MFGNSFLGNSAAGAMNGNQQSQNTQLNQANGALLGGSSVASSLPSSGYGQGYLGGTSSGVFTWPYTTNVTPTPDITIRKVENGFILIMEGKEYIITDNKQVLKYMELCGKKVNEIK